MDLVAKKPIQLRVIARSTSPRRRPVPVIALAMGASMLCAGLFITYALAALMFPPLRAFEHSLGWVLPGFSFVHIGRVMLGMAESFAWGLYGALLIGCAFNYLASRKRKAR